MRFLIVFIFISSQAYSQQQIECKVDAFYKSGIRSYKESGMNQNSNFKPTCQIKCGSIEGLIESSDENCTRGSKVLLHPKTVIYHDDAGVLTDAHYVNGDYISSTDAIRLLKAKKIVDDPNFKGVDAITFTSVDSLNCTLQTRQAFYVDAGEYNEQAGYEAQRQCKTDQAIVKCVLKQGAGVCKMEFRCSGTGNVKGYGGIESNKVETSVCNANISGASVTCPTLAECIPAETGEFNQTIYWEKLQPRGELNGLQIKEKNIGVGR